MDRVKPANVTFTWVLAFKETDAMHTETISVNQDGTFRVQSTLTMRFFRRDDLHSLECVVTHGVNRKYSSSAKDKLIVYCKLYLEFLLTFCLL